MTPLRVYVETSVWSFVFADDAPDYQRDTLVFFDHCRSGGIEPIISTVVLQELSQSSEPLRSQLVGTVREIQPVVLDYTGDMEILADAFREHGIVPPSKPEDADHVAAAFVAELDVLVSWNFRHIVSVRRADRFNAVAKLRGFAKPLHIVTPAEVLDDEEE